MARHAGRAPARPAAAPGAGAASSGLENPEQSMAGAELRGPLTAGRGCRGLGGGRVTSAPRSRGSGHEVGGARVACAGIRTALGRAGNRLHCGRSAGDHRRPSQLRGAETGGRGRRRRETRGRWRRARSPGLREAGGSGGLGAGDAGAREAGRGAVGWGTYLPWVLERPREAWVPHPDGTLTCFVDDPCSQFSTTFLS